MSLFSENLKDIRNKANISRKEIAEKIGVTLVAYGNYEKGDREPRLDTLVKIASVLQCSVDDLLSYKPQVDETKIITNELEKMNIDFEIKDNKFLFHGSIKNTVLSLFTSSDIPNDDFCNFSMAISIDDFKNLYKTLKITHEQSDSYREGFKNLLLLALQDRFYYHFFKSYYKEKAVFDEKLRQAKSRPQS